MTDFDAQTATIGVVGAGAMGQGIVQVALQGGLQVRLYDAKPDAAEAGRDKVFARLRRLVEKGRLDATDVDAMEGRLTLVPALAEMRPCAAVVEAVFEDLDLKRNVFAELEGHVAADAILASNTSSISIAAIASQCRHKGRVAGLHFFNPVPLMRLVEVVVGPDTRPEVADALMTLGERLGRTPVRVKDAPGFLVNMGGRAYTTEALHILHERVATPAQIDAVMRDGCGYRMGPCELMDLTGIDVNYPVSRIVHEGYMYDPRLRTTPGHRALHEAGRHGRKTGQGHFAYDTEGKRTDADSPDLRVDAEPAAAVAMAEADDRLRRFLDDIGLRVLSADHGRTPIVAAPVGEDASALAARTGADPRRLVALDLLCDTDTRVTLMTPPGADAAARDGVAAAIAGSGRAVTAIADSCGFVSQRMQAMIANLGCEMAQIGLAEPEAIDTAMKLGLNYPRGPLEICDHLGPTTVLHIMRRLQALTGDDRYRPSPWLRRRAELDLPIHTP